MSPKRLLLAAAACAVVVVPGSAVAGAATTTPPRSQLRSFVCQKALDPPARAVSVQAVMRPVADTSKLEMRFELLRQKPGHPFVKVRGHNLGAWISPQDATLGQNPGDVWVVNHPVVNLSAPATYKFRVSFRWLGSDGQTLSQVTQTTANCYEPELRPDLLVRSLTVKSINAGQNAGQALYTAVIANRGLSAAGAFTVQFTDAAGLSQTDPVTGLGPKSSTKTQFVAAPCTAGSTLTVTADPTHNVAEYDFANNTLTMACPAPATSSTSSASSSPAPASPSS
jgi:hypothetical protein